MSRVIEVGKDVIELADYLVDTDPVWEQKGLIQLLRSGANVMIEL